MFTAGINWSYASVVCCSYNLDIEEKREGVNWSDSKTLPLSEQGTLCVTGPNQVRPTPLCCVCIVLATAAHEWFYITDAPTARRSGLVVLRPFHARYPESDGDKAVVDEDAFNGLASRNLGCRDADEQVNQ